MRARSGPAAAALAIAGFEMLNLALIVNSMALVIVATVVAIVGGAVGVVGVASRSNRVGSRLLGLTGIVVAIFSAVLVVNGEHHRLDSGVDPGYQAAEASRRSEDCALLQRGQVPVGQIVMMPSVFPASAVSCQLRGVNLSGAALAEAGLWNTDLSGANLSGANLRHARFDNANLTGANLQGADLTDAILLDAKLVNVDLTGADLTGAMVNDADFTGATWAHTTCPSGTNSDLRGHVIEEPASRLGVALVGGTCVGEGHLGTRPR